MSTLFLFTAFSGAAIALFSTASNAQQQLPAPSRTVFKCTANGATTYSDTPCLGAQRIDVEPTRGADSISGRKQIGSDVQREKTRETIAEAIRPLTGMDANQLDTAARRQKLSPNAQRECRELDNNLPTVEREEATAEKEIRSNIEFRLLGVRQRYRDLNC